MLQRFEALQARWATLGAGGRTEPSRPCTVVVLPSLPSPSAVSAAERRAAEQRALATLGLLRDPDARLVLLCATPPDPAAVERIVAAMEASGVPGVRDRWVAIAAGDGGPEPLARKFVRRPRVLERVRAAVGTGDRAWLLPLHAGSDERRLAVRLGLPMYATLPETVELDRPAAARSLFAEAGLQALPAGEHVRGFDDIVGAVTKLRFEQPELAGVVVWAHAPEAGRAEIAFEQLPPSGDLAEPAALTRSVRAMRFSRPDMDLGRFLSLLGEQGGVLEQRPAGATRREPVVGFEIEPERTVRCTGSWEPIEDGPPVRYRSPADPEYARVLQQEALAVARRLADRGGLGHFALRFVVVRTAAGSWRPYAAAITPGLAAHAMPELLARALLGAKYDPARAEYVDEASKGHAVAWVHEWAEPRFEALQPADIEAMLRETGLAFDPATRRGIVPDMVAAVTERGVLGWSALAPTVGEAQALLERAGEALEQEAQRASVHAPL
ncbi:MAG: hypothetical protein D6776_07690 [Planctomycetota bacterium]|nr:MAG: hypothetical protein D6776_07690 [Planctomycetota bacterium]